MKEKPWKKRLDLFNSTVKERDAIKESLNEPIELSKGSEFIVPIQVKVQNLIRISKIVIFKKTISLS